MGCNVSGDATATDYDDDGNYNVDVFLTVHHSIDFSKYQLSAQFF